MKEIEQLAAERLAAAISNVNHNEPRTLKFLNFKTRVEKPMRESKNYLALNKQELIQMQQSSIPIASSLPNIKKPLKR